MLDVIKTLEIVLIKHLIYVRHMLPVFPKSYIRFILK